MCIELLKVAEYYDHVYLHELSGGLFIIVLMVINNLKLDSGIFIAM